MRTYANHPLTLWLVLVLATVVSWWLGSNDANGSHQPAILTRTAIFSVAIVKCRLVIRHYMEVRFAPPWLRWACDAWLLLNLGMVSSFYWLAI
jgi:hypothetical protein